MALFEFWTRQRKPGIFDNITGIRVLEDLEITNINASITTRALTHPTESSDTVVDNIVNEPANIEVHFMVNSQDYSSIFDTLKFFRTQAKLLAVQSRTQLFKNLIITSNPIRESSRHYDKVTSVLLFTEILEEQRDTLFSRIESLFDPADLSERVLGRVLPAPIQNLGVIDLVTQGVRNARLPAGRPTDFLLVNRLKPIIRRVL